MEGEKAGFHDFLTGVDDVLVERFGGFVLVGPGASGRRIGVVIFAEGRLEQAELGLVGQGDPFVDNGAAGGEELAGSQAVLAREVDVFEHHVEDVFPVVSAFEEERVIFGNHMVDPRQVAELLELGEIQERPPEAGYAHIMVVDFGRDCVFCADHVGYHVVGATDAGPVSGCPSGFTLGVPDARLVEGVALFGSYEVGVHVAQGDVVPTREVAVKQAVGRKAEIRLVGVVTVGRNLVGRLLVEEILT